MPVSMSTVNGSSTITAVNVWQCREMDSMEEGLFGMLFHLSQRCVQVDLMVFLQGGWSVLCQRLTAGPGIPTASAMFVIWSLYDTIILSSQATDSLGAVLLLSSSVDALNLLSLLLFPKRMGSSRYNPYHPMVGSCSGLLNMSSYISISIDSRPSDLQRYICGQLASGFDSRLLPNVYFSKSRGLGFSLFCGM